MLLPTLKPLCLHLATGTLPRIEFSPIFFLKAARPCRSYSLANQNRSRCIFCHEGGKGSFARPTCCHVASCAERGFLLAMTCWHQCFLLAMTCWQQCFLLAMTCWQQCPETALRLETSAGRLTKSCMACSLLIVCEDPSINGSNRRRIQSPSAFKQRYNHLCHAEKCCSKLIYPGFFKQIFTLLSC